ncbi:MAG: DUF1905 domain-containing protein [Bacteroidetes bacterium]|jgi:thiamine phosphate synthase YjbQ (UPF0047 family)|nr:DUF1905 domain-containing protein [Bacteroidota bacterium]
MEYLVKDTLLEIKHEPRKGAWTYHIQIPNTKHMVGKWGSLKATGTVDNYKIESINLFTIAGQDKLISINKEIRKALNKSGVNKVLVTLSLLNEKQNITEKEILETFDQSDVLKIFETFSEQRKRKIIEEIKAQKSEDKQIKSLLNFIDQLTLEND